MITRIVRMEFAKDKVDDFKKLFMLTYPDIRNFDGCRFLELYADHHQSNVYFTISRWDSDAKLEAYRNSELFKRTWATTKTFFSGPPLAYSLAKEVEDATNQ